MLNDNITTLKKDLADTYNIFNSIEIKTEHYNAKKYGIAMDMLSDIFNRIDKIFALVEENTNEISNAPNELNT